MKKQKSVEQFSQSSNQMPNLNEMTIDCLNDDCLIGIFDYLDIKEKLKIQSVNKRWNQVSKLSWNQTKFKLARIVPPPVTIKRSYDSDDSDSEFYEYEDNSKKTERTNFVTKVVKNNAFYIHKLTLKSNAIKSLEYELLFKELPMHFKNLTHLSLTCNIDDFGTEIFTDNNLKLLFSSNVNLRSIKMKKITVNGDCLLGLRTENIKELCIKDCDFKYKGYFYGFMSNLKNLNKFRLERRNDEINIVPLIDALVMSKCEDLREVSFSILKEYTNQNLSLFLSKQKKLQKLDLKGILIDSNLIESLSGEHLEVLSDLTFKKSYSRNDPLHSFYLLENLRELDCNFEDLTDNSLLALTTSMSLSIKTLYIHFREYSITEELIRKFMIFQKNYSLSNECQSKFRILHNLESLHIRVGKITPDNISTNIFYLLQYFSECVNLKNLNIYLSNFNVLEKDSDHIYPALESLEIFLSSVQDADIAYFVNKSLRLKKIKLLYCKNITEEIIKIISDIKNNRGDTHSIEIIFSIDPTDQKNFDKEKYANLSSLVKVKY